MAVSSRLLGNVIQDFLHAVIEMKISDSVEGEKKFNSRYFVPDIVIPDFEDPHTIIHVTHSRTQGMTNRKFFRNIEEIFETHISFPNARSINFTFGPVDSITYHDLNIEAQNLLFHESWYSYENWGGEEVDSNYGKIMYDFARDNLAPPCKSAEPGEERRELIKEILKKKLEKDEDFEKAFDLFGFGTKISLFLS